MEGVAIPDSPNKRLSKAPRNRIVFCAVVVLWFFVDRMTKVFFEDRLAEAFVLPSIPGVVEIDLVHNYGAAWGSFAGQVDGLIIVTVILIIAIAVFSFFAAKTASLLEMVGLALIFAGGLGNLFDRVFFGYVIDFIAPLFIDFPTFNIADVGITCGISIVLISFAIEFFAHRQHPELQAGLNDSKGR